MFYHAQLVMDVDKFLANFQNQIARNLVDVDLELVDSIEMKLRPSSERRRALDSSFDFPFS